MFNHYIYLSKQRIVQIGFVWSVFILSFNAYAVCNTVTEIPVAECEALENFYNNLGGPSWADSPANQWTLTDTPCSWAGVRCELGHVKEIERIGQQLSGTLPSLIELTQLKSFDVTNNNIQGTFDSSLFPSSIKLLKLGRNELDNNLDVDPLASLTRLPLLSILDLSGNRFSGELPDLNTLNLTEIDVSANVLHGSSTIPAWLENVPSVNISYNMFQVNNLSPSLTEHLARQNNNLTTQTIPPKVTNIMRLSENTAQITWTPIAYREDTGYYEVRCYDHPLDNPGPLLNSQRTADKNANSLILEGLTPGANYFCGIATVTEPHGIQKNIINHMAPFGEIRAQVNPNQAPILEPIANQAVTLGQTLDLTAKASDPDNDELAFSLSDSPTDAVIGKDTGRLAWNPITSGDFPFTVMVSDLGHVSTATLMDSTTFTVHVNQAPQIVALSKQTVTVGETMLFTVNATDANHNKLQYNATNLPTDASLNSATGEFLWQPAIPTTISVKFTVAELDGRPNNLFAEQAVVLEALAAEEPTTEEPTTPPATPIPPTSPPVTSPGSNVNSGLVISDPIVDLNINTIVRNESGNILENPTIGPNASISGGILAGNITNQGLVSNTVIRGTLTGGRLSGTVINQGTVCGTEVSVYATVEGGLFCDHTDNQGHIINGTVLASGTIEGGEVGKRVRSYGLLKDVTLKPFAQIVGGVLEGRIIGDEEGIAQIGAVEIAEDATLCNVRLSPTVILPNNMNLCENVFFPEIPEEPILEDFGIDPQTISQFDAQRISEIEPAAFSYFTDEEFSSIPPDALTAITPEQIAAIRAETLEDMTPEQFAHIPLSSLVGFTAENIAGIPSNVLNTITREQLDALDAEKVRESEALASVLTNLNPMLTTEDAQPLLPEEWKMDEAGHLTAPEGAKVGYHVVMPNMPAQIGLPLQFNLGTGFGLSGWSQPGQNLQDDLQAALATQNLPFIIVQGQDGILRIEGQGEFQDTHLAFIIDVDNAIQAGTDAPVGLSSTATGKFVLTTPKKQQFPLIPTTQNPVDLFNSLAALTLAIDKDGITLATVPANTRAEDFVHRVFMFDPFIFPNPPPPDDFTPGIHFQRRIRAASPEQGFIVYENDTLQDITATVPSPNLFIAEGMKFEGVESIIFNVDGTFSIVFQGINLRAIPTFNVNSSEVQGDPRRFKPSLELNQDGSLQYRVLYNNQVLSIKLGLIAEG